MQNKVPITTKLPKSLHQNLLQQVIQDGYGMRGKSKWISESIERLLALSNFPELVEIANEVEELTDIIGIRITKNLLDKLDHAVIDIRKQYPSIEGVKSKIVRASIIQRLLRG